MCAQVAASSNKVTNFVGKVVNGFDIQKLIGAFTPSLAIHRRLITLFCRPGQVFLRLQGKANEQWSDGRLKTDQSKSAA
jgi:hypothetical protein